MPIVGVTDKLNTRTETNRLGSCWKGDKKKANRAGKDLVDKFRLELPAPYDAAIKSTYGTTWPTQVRVFFPHHTTDEVFETWNDAFTAKGLAHRCNGENIVREVGLVDSYRGGKQYKKRSAEDVSKPCLKKPGEAICSKCVSTGYLKFVIRELFPYAGMSQVVMQSLTGITDVIGVTKQLRALEERYGSLRQSPVPSPSTWNHIPFVLKRVPREIARPMMDTDGGYTRTTAYPIVITEDPEWLKFWQEATQRAMILEMVKNGQAGLLQESDRSILQEMQALNLPMAGAESLAISEGNQDVLPVAESQEPSQLALEPSAESTLDTFAEADNDVAEEYRAQMLGRSPKERVAAVNQHTKLTEEVLTDLWGQVDQSLEGPDKTSEFIELILLYYAENHMVKQADAMKLMVRLQDDLGLVDEGLAEMFIPELPNHVRPAPQEKPTTFNNVSID
ncbi:MAG: hypothetical protein AAGA46_03515 [Cyanobacteria bacterium P01_F01_bin.13]